MRTLIRTSDAILLLRLILSRARLSLEERERTEAALSFLLLETQETD